jgi:CheY-like chemotaxis protein
MIPGNQGWSMSPEQRRILVVRDNSANPYFTKIKLFSSLVLHFIAHHQQKQALQNIVHQAENQHPEDKSRSRKNNTTQHTIG